MSFRLTGANGLDPFGIKSRVRGSGTPCLTIKERLRIHRIVMQGVHDLLLAHVKVPNRTVGTSAYFVRRLRRCMWQAGMPALLDRGWNGIHCCAQNEGGQAQGGTMSRSTSLRHWQDASGTRRSLGTRDFRHWQDASGTRRSLGTSAFEKTGERCQEPSEKVPDTFSPTSETMASL